MIADDFDTSKGGYILTLRKGVVKQLAGEVTIALADRLTPMLQRRLMRVGAGDLVFEIPDTPDKRKTKLRADLARAGIRLRTRRGVFNARTFRLSGNVWATSAGVSGDDRHLLRLDLGEGDDRLINWTYQDFEKQWPRFRSCWATISDWHDREWYGRAVADGSGVVAKVGAA